MLIFLSLLSLALALYFAVRLYLIKNALKETEKDLQSIRKDISKNQVLHLPLPDHDLEELMKTINSALDAVRNERKEYARRENEFQSQIEAISHDLRTPLTVILGYLGFLQKQRTSLTLEQREMLDVIERKTRSMEKLISQFYDYSRITAGDYEISTDEIDAGRILREVFTENCIILEESHLNVIADLPNYPIWVLGEKTALDRIFSNLFQNVGRYAHNYLKIFISDNEEKVQIIFENDTQKITEKEVSYIFNRFYMADASRNNGGTGLGLTIAKCLAEEMGGSLDADLIKSENDGTLSLRFTLCLTPCIPNNSTSIN